MKKPLSPLFTAIERFISRLGLGMRAKLVLIFMMIKVIPLVILTLLAWRQARLLGEELNRQARHLRADANEALVKTGVLAVDDSIRLLNRFATEDIERISTDMARRVADFLYERDGDIIFASELDVDERAYRQFIENRRGILIKPGRWELAPDGKSWAPAKTPPAAPRVNSSNGENDQNFRYRPPDVFETESRPLYLEITYIDLDGNEIIKVTGSPRMDSRRKNVADRRNTYVRAETYFGELKNLKPGEIYVSEVIGAYVPSRLIGLYTPESAAARGLEYRPEEEAYAGEENPLGKRFEGLIRWAAPVTRNGKITGYVTLALDHDHLMEFTDHTTPTNERYTELASAYEGNYAFIWDYQCRSICHPRHHSIAGYNPETGEPEIPWLEESIYQAWRESGREYTEFIKDVPVFADQSREKRPAEALTKQGLVGLDGRYLNHAPQCTGWYDLTREGGSGSFLILWSGLWKLTTAAAIPYYTGRYGSSKRGFGFVTVGSGFEDFEGPARETEKALQEVIAGANQTLNRAAEETRSAIDKHLLKTTFSLAASAGFMIFLVVLIAIWMASIFTRSITTLINGISRFRAGERHFRFNALVKDEMGTLADSFDEMADSLVAGDQGPVVILRRDHTIIYVNEQSLKTIKKNLEEVLGKNYGEISVYPANTPQDPIAALEEGRDAEILYRPNTGQYIRGVASHLTDKAGKNIGFIITTMDLTELVEQQKKLEQAVNNANQANAHKGEFLARMSHEIRTPMNAIIGMTSIVKGELEEENPPLGEIQTQVEQIETSSQHLMGLLNDVLDISKIEAGKIELTEEAVDLLKLANTVVAIIKGRCDEKNIAFETRFDIPGDRDYISDALRLRQVLINLLGNAVKFTPQDGKVSFSVLQKERREGRTFFEFTILDTGIGISEEAQRSLFKPFEQANSRISQKYGGTGLGLAISQNIVTLLGGNIQVRSKEWKGSEFTFGLWMNETEAGGKTEITIENAADIFKGKRALLVDDVPINRIIAANFLEVTGLIIDEADDGLNAVEAFSKSPEHTYDIIYMDVQMPNMNGYEASTAIRAMERSDAKTVPIVALTANAFKEDIDRARQYGMNAHVAKPMDAEKLLEVSLRFLGTGGKPGDEDGRKAAP